MRSISEGTPYHKVSFCRPRSGWYERAFDTAAPCRSTRGLKPWCGRSAAARESRAKARYLKITGGGSGLRSAPARFSSAAVAAVYGLALAHERIRLRGETTYRRPVKFNKWTTPETVAQAASIKSNITILDLDLARRWRREGITSTRAAGRSSVDCAPPIRYLALFSLQLAAGNA